MTSLDSYPAPNYEFWTKQRFFTSDQAAWLFLEKQPQVHRGTFIAPNWPIEVECLINDFCSLRIARDTFEPSPSDHYSRDTLEAIAKIWGFRPRFLFTEDCPLIDADRLQQENAELRARIAMLESELLEPHPNSRNNLYRIIAALLDLPRIDPEAEFTTIHKDINTRLELMGAHPIKKPDTVAKVIKAARALIDKERDLD